MPYGTLSCNGFTKQFMVTFTIFLCYVTTHGSRYIFELNSIQATIKLFTLFGWALFVAGVLLLCLDTAIEYQNGRGKYKDNGD